MKNQMQTWEADKVVRLLMKKPDGFYQQTNVGGSKKVIPVDESVVLTETVYQKTKDMIILHDANMGKSRVLKRL